MPSEPIRVEVVCPLSQFHEMMMRGGEAVISLPLNPTSYAARQIELAVAADAMDLENAAHSGGPTTEAYQLAFIAHRLALKAVREHPDHPKGGPREQK